MTATHEYVDLELEFKDGVCVGCRHLGAGSQVDPIIDATVMQILEADESVPLSRDARNRLVRYIRLAFRNV